MTILHFVKPESTNPLNTTNLENNNDILTENKNTDNKENTETVTIDGPLSGVYYEALMKVFGNDKKQDVDISVESAANDTIISIANKLQEEILQEDNLEHHYVYVTNVDELKEGDDINAFKKLRLALDSKRFKTITAVMESNGVINNKMALLDEYSRTNKAKVCYTRKSALLHLNNIIKKTYA